jgi:membrane protease YdiL (CAAX protease family)
MMHIGTGLDPIPLFVLGLALGYLYQRTHRILPCIVLHALFNGFSLGILWLMRSLAL